MTKVKPISTRLLGLDGLLGGGLQRGEVTEFCTLSTLIVYSDIMRMTVSVCILVFVHNERWWSWFGKNATRVGHVMH